MLKKLFNATFSDVLAVALMFFALCTVIIPFIFQNLALCGIAVSVALLVKSVISQNRLKVVENE